ncbi:electron transport complex, RnfABCDGE type, C subunit [Thioalkalivibrio sp. K90mix]|uniref:electron transport complex subunit RsxC n=1 Tax=Thioalkalivibrio sp. (strain K90mix) TaxID=396595 RepID=UPI000195A594|nr:electron transport complex subunit RsxC [Thioalkalivibrio sp. K90mix]ADC72283.1 electron transport complex, RnfABCDGE type, C subunit [Thioalkalivibrio sp. K90mix]
MQLHRFHGGLKLADETDASTAEPVLVMGVPAKLTVPLGQHIGEATEACVQVGDHVTKGQRIGQSKGYIAAHVHAPTSGKVVDIDLYPVPHPSGLDAPCVVIEPDGHDDWGDARMEPWLDWDTRDLRALRQRLRAGGIVGLGGAAFPTAVKLNPRAGQRIHTLVVNGAECEPYISADDMLLRTAPEAVFEGIRITARLLGVERVLFAVEDNMPEAMRSLTETLPPELRDLIELVSVPSIYPTGGERQLIKVLTGQEVPSGGLPADLGMVCHNPGTFKAICDTVIQGRPLLSRIVTVTGPGVKHPRNVEALLGTPFADVIEAAGGYAEGVDRLVMGGPMMGFAVHDDSIPVIKATNCLLATRPQDTPDPGPVMPCIRCAECAAVCPAQLLPQQLYWQAKAKDFDAIQDYGLFDCIECGCCAYVCPSNIPLVQYYRYAKNEIWAREKERHKSDIARERYEFRQERIEREEREKAERLAKKKAALKNKEADGDKQAAIQAALERAQKKKAARAEESAKGSDQAPGSETTREETSTTNDTRDRDDR